MNSNNNVKKEETNATGALYKAVQQVRPPPTVAKPEPGSQQTPSQYGVPPSTSIQQQQQQSTSMSAASSSMQSSMPSHLNQPPNSTTASAGTNNANNNNQFSAALAAMPDRLKDLWKQQRHEMGSLDISSKNDFKHHNDLPLARIKRIMKSDEDVRMISAEAPILFAKACEMFILDLTVRSWCYSEHNKRNGLEKDDIYAVLQNTDIFDFLAEVVINNPEPRERPPNAP